MNATSFFLTLVTIALTASPAWATTYKGKCAKQAETAAVEKWADVPNPDPNLEYITMSSEETGRESDTYIVVLALNDGNEQAMAKYQVKFGEPAACKKPAVSAAK